MTTGTEVKVAVIDSGVHAAHPHVRGVAGGVGVDDYGRLHQDYVDRLGHGTAVTAVICEKAPNARLWAVKVFDRQLTATGEALVAALRWARAHHMDIVNLSLGTCNVDRERDLADEVRAARALGMLIVAAAPEPSRRWLPGAVPGVLRVRTDMSMPRHACHAVEVAAGYIEAAASGYPRPIPGVPAERNLKGLSFAVANVTGLVAQAWPAWRPALLLQSDRSLSESQL